MTFILRPIAVLGGRALALVEFLGGVGYLLRDSFAAIPRGLLAKRGRRLAWKNLWAQMVRVGVRSIPIVMLVLFCIGAILSLQMAPVLKGYGAIAVLVESLKLLHRVGGKVCLINLQPRVKGILEISRLNAVFSICKDEQEALTK